MTNQRRCLTVHRVFQPSEAANLNPAAFSLLKIQSEQIHLNSADQTNHQATGA